MNSGIEEAHRGTRQKERVIPSGQLENYREKSFFNDWFDVLKVDGYASLEYLLALLLAVVWSELTCLCRLLMPRLFELFLRMIIFVSLYFKNRKGQLLKLSKQCLLKFRLVIKKV